ncbi:MAG: hypothetical protein GY778_06635 [bacterium]|nr:hypothetical protein [bacterium]
MNSAHQVALLLKVMLLVGPIAVYFMVLGLLNSQARPKLVNARTDFLILTAAVVPVLLVPAAPIFGQGRGWLALPLVAVAGLALWALLPRQDTGWVIYNVSAPRARVLLQRCLRDLGWAFQESGPEMNVPPLGLTIRLSGLPVLRNVTCSLKCDRPADRARVCQLLGARLEPALARQDLLPSAAGSCLMLVGIALMILPLWMMSRHSDAVAQVVSGILLG